MNVFLYFLCHLKKKATPMYSIKSNILHMAVGRRPSIFATPLRLINYQNILAIQYPFHLPAKVNPMQKVLESESTSLRTRTRNVSTG